MSQLNDISLVAQVVVFRNTGAFDQLVKKYQSPVRRFFLNLTCGDNELSDDWRRTRLSKPTLTGFIQKPVQFFPWLYRIAYNVFYDYLRSRKETADLDTREVDTHWNTSQDDVGQQMDVYRALATLKRNGTNLHHLVLHGRSEHRKDCRYHGMPGGNSQKPPLAGKRKNGYLLKTKWL